MNRRSLLKSLSVLPAAALSPGITFSAAAANQPSRLRTAICAYSFRDALKSKSMTYDDLVHLAVDLDLDGIDMTVYWFPDTSDEFLLPLRRLAYKNGVEIYSICIRSDMCLPTPEAQEREVAWVQKWVDVAEKLGAGHIRVFGGEVPKQATEEQAAEWVVQVMKEAASYSGKKGIVLGLENHGGITSRAERLIQIVRQVDSPWVGINLDTGNFDDDGYAQVEACVPYAVNVQLKTEIKNKGREAPADWDRLMTLLVQGGYRGYVALEYEANETASIAVPRLIRRLHEVVKKHSQSS